MIDKDIDMKSSVGVNPAGLLQGHAADTVTVPEHCNIHTLHNPPV